MKLRARDDRDLTAGAGAVADDERHAKLGSIWKTRRWRGQRGDTHPAAGAEDRAIVIRRRRVVALMVIAAALIIAIEVAVTLFLIPG